MRFLCLSELFGVRSMIATVFCSVVFLPSLTWAGDRDTHLTATHFLARHLGISEQEAEIIASADWSMDKNTSTVATPTGIGVPFTGKLVPGGVQIKVGDLAGRSQGDPPPIVSWYERGKAEHAFDSRNVWALFGAKTDPQNVLKQLSSLKTDVEVAMRKGDRVSTDRILGQYLHALQDAYYHQNEDGKPYESGAGHFFRNLNGNPADSVAQHSDAAVRALQATYLTLQAFHDGKSLPDPASLDIYHAPDQGSRYLTPGRTSGDVLRLVQALSKSYDRREIDDTEQGDILAPGLGGGSGREVIFDRHPTPEVLNNNLNALWHSMHKNDDSYNPALKLKDEPNNGFPKGAGEVERINFDTHPNWLAPHLFGAIRGVNIDVKGGLIKSKDTSGPGGMSLTGAAALAMPIDIDLDAVHYDQTTNSVILSGHNSGGQQFDAAIFLTSLRLACEPSDPYFSLDPIDAKAFEQQSRQALAELMALAKSRFRPDAAHLTTRELLAQIQGIDVYSPEFQAHSIDKEDHDAFWRLLERYPALRPKLVFRPEWLRQTRLGEILYRADVMLKEFDTGLSALDLGHDPSVRSVANYVSPQTRSVAAQLLESLRGKARERDRITGWRLWFDLAEQPGPAASSAPPDVRSASKTSRVDAEIADRIEDEFKRQHLIVAPETDGPSALPEVRENQQTLDLSQVFPKMFVRRHEMGKDLPGSDPYLDLLAADVNNRLMIYAAQYKELEDLIQVFRAYVAARKIMAQYPGGCKTLQQLPLFPSEKLQKDLPAQHPTPLISVHLASAALKDARGQRKLVSRIDSLDGGVGMNYGLLKSSENSPTPLTNEVQHAAQERPVSTLVWRVPEGGGQANREFIALRFDLDGPANRGFKPVTMKTVIRDLDQQLDDVIRKGDLYQAQQENDNLTRTNRRLRAYLMILLCTLVVAGGGNGYLLMRLRQRSAAQPSPLNLPTGQEPEAAAPASQKWW